MVNKLEILRTSYPISNKFEVTQAFGPVKRMRSSECIGKNEGEKIYKYHLKLTDHDYRENELSTNELQAEYKKFGFRETSPYYMPTNDMTIYDIIYNWVIYNKKIYDEGQGKVFGKISELYAIRELNRKINEWYPKNRDEFQESFPKKGWDTSKSLGVWISIERQLPIKDYPYSHQFYLGEGNHRIKQLYLWLQAGLIEDMMIPVQFVFRGNMGRLERPKSQKD